MTQTARARLARSLWVLALLLAVGSAALMVGNLPVRSDVSYLALLAPGFSTVGMVIATRRPNMVGWLFLAVGLVGAVGGFTGEYALRTLQAEPGSLPGAAFMAWVSSWVVLSDPPPPLSSHGIMVSARPAKSWRRPIGCARRSSVNSRAL